MASGNPLISNGHQQKQIETKKTAFVTTAKIEKFISDRMIEGTNILTLGKIIVSLDQIMRHAVRHRYIDFNPVREAEKPRSQEQENSFDKKIRILTPKQINSLFDAVTDYKYQRFGDQNKQS